MPEPIQDAPFRRLLRETSWERGPRAPASIQLLCRLLMHELRTPLNAVTGFAELLLAGAAGPLTQEAVDHVRAISRAAAAAARALAVAQELVDLAATPRATMRCSERVDLLSMLRRHGFVVPAGAGPGWIIPGPPEAWARVVAGCRRYLAGGAGEEPRLEAVVAPPMGTRLELRLGRMAPSTADGTGLLELALARQLARRCGGRLDPADDGALVLVVAAPRRRKKRRNGAGS